jgi:hypothetical protein
MPNGRRMHGVRLSGVTRTRAAEGTRTEGRRSHVDQDYPCARRTRAVRAMGSPMITRGLPRLLLARARAPSANLRLTVDPAGPLADKGAELLVCVAGSFLAVPVAPGNAVLCVNGDVGEVLGPAGTDSDAEAAAALLDNVARTVHVRPAVDLEQALTRRGISVLRYTHKAGPSRNEQFHHHAPVALPIGQLYEGRQIESTGCATGQQKPAALPELPKARAAY